MQLWDAFLEDYGNEIHDWAPRQLLEIFWYYCQDGSRAVHRFLNQCDCHFMGDGRIEADGDCPVHGQDSS